MGKHQVVSFDSHSFYSYTQYSNWDNLIIVCICNGRCKKLVFRHILRLKVSSIFNILWLWERVLLCLRRWRTHTGGFYSRGVNPWLHCTKRGAKRIPPAQSLPVPLKMCRNNTCFAYVIDAAWLFPSYPRNLCGSLRNRYGYRLPMNGFVFLLQI